MMNVEPTYQLIECDQDTAIQHLAMAQMMDEENAEQDSVRIPVEQDEQKEARRIILSIFHRWISIFLVHAV